MHWFEDTLVTLHYSLNRTSTLHDIALRNAYKAVIGIGIYEYLEVHLLTENRIVQRHDTFYDDNLARIDMNRLFLARRSDIIIDRLLDGIAIFEHFDMFGKESPIKSIWMVKVDILTLLKRYMTTIVIVGILRDNNYFTMRKTFDKFAYHSCFSRAGTARNADDKHIFLEIIGRPAGYKTAFRL